MANYFIPKVWHAFQSLKESSDSNYVPRSKLKVLNQNLGSVIQLDFQKPYEDVFPEEEFKQKPGVTFDEYESFLICHVLAKLPQLQERPNEESSLVTSDTLTVDGQASPSVSRRISRNQKKKTDTWEGQNSFFYNGSKANTDWDKLDDVCWLLYKKYAFPKPPPGLTSTTLFLLWKLFITYSKTIDKAGVINVPVVIDAEELDYWLGRFSEYFAREPRQKTALTEQAEFLNFEQVIERVVELQEYLSITANDAEMAFVELVDEALNGVIRKGYLIKKGKKEWKNMWCVLTANNFAFFSEEDKTERRGQISIKSNFVLESPTVRGDRGTKFQITSDEGVNVFEAADLRSKNSWLQDFQAAIRYQSEGITNWSIHEGQKRQERREAAREKRRIEREERNLELKLILQAKEELEKRLQEEHISLEKERERIQELEQMQESLQKALDDEKQARADEEIVRKLQSQLLEDEKNARNKMNLLIREKETILTSEMNRRSDVEKLLSTEKAKMDQILYEKGQLTVKLEEEDKIKEETKKELTNLQSQLELKQEELLLMKQKIVETTESFTREKEETGACFDQQIEQYRNQIEELMDLNTNFKEELKWLKLEVHRLTSELDKENSAKKDLERKLTDIQSELKSMEKEVENSMNEKVAVQKELNTCKQNFMQQISEKSEELDKERDLRKKLEDDKVNQEAYMFNEIDKRAQMEIEVSNHKSKAERLNKECAELKEKLEVALQDLQKSKIKIVELTERMGSETNVEEPPQKEQLVPAEPSPSPPKSVTHEDQPITTPPPTTGWTRLFRK